MQAVPSDKCLQAFFSYCKFPSLKVNCRIVNVAKQAGGSDCGLYALAYAAVPSDKCLVSGDNPINVEYEQNIMHEHLLQCLENKTMSACPARGPRRVRRQRVRAFQVELHCICHVPYVKGAEMIQCDKCRVWYHSDCVGLTTVEFLLFLEQKDRLYVCTGCNAQ